jgi:hypothetical protein
MTILLMIIVAIAIIVAYITGRVQGIPDYYCLPCQNHPLNNPPYDYPSFNDCNYISRITAKINEDMAYQRGKQAGHISAWEDLRFRPSEDKQKEFIEKFTKDMKPLEELKKDLKI